MEERWEGRRGVMTQTVNIMQADPQLGLNQ